MTERMREFVCYHGPDALEIARRSVPHGKPIVEPEPGTIWPELVGNLFPMPDPEGVPGNPPAYVFKPGALMLAQGGLVILDRLPEWDLQVLRAIAALPGQAAALAIEGDPDKGPCPRWLALILELHFEFKLAVISRVCPCLDRDYCGCTPRKKRAYMHATENALRALIAGSQRDQESPVTFGPESLN